MSGGKKRELRVILTDSELSALRKVIQFVVDDPQTLSGLFAHHNQMNSAERMRNKIIEATWSLREVR